MSMQFEDVQNRIREIQYQVLQTEPRATFTQIELGLQEYEAIKKFAMDNNVASVPAQPDTYEGMIIKRSWAPSKITLVYRTGVVSKEL